jgi:hypothetical protein
MQSAASSPLCLLFLLEAQPNHSSQASSGKTVAKVARVNGALSLSALSMIAAANVFSFRGFQPEPVSRHRHLNGSKGVEVRCAL